MGKPIKTTDHRTSGLIVALSVVATAGFGALFTIDAPNTLTFAGFIPRHLRLIVAPVAERALFGAKEWIGGRNEAI